MKLRRSAIVPSPEPWVFLLLTAVACAHATLSFDARVHHARAWVSAMHYEGDSGVWFSDELAPVVDALAEVLAREEYGGLRIIPPSEVRQLESNARRGVLPGVPLVCDNPPEPQNLTRALHPDALQIDNLIRCHGLTCELFAAATLPENHEVEVVRYMAKLRWGASPSEWAAAIRAGALKRIEPDPSQEGFAPVSVFRFLRKRVGTHLSVADPVTTGRWPGLEEKQSPPFERELLACQHGDSNPLDEFRIDVDPSGRVSHCEYGAPDGFVGTASACMCAVFLNRSIGPSVGPLRARFSLERLEVLPNGELPNPVHRTGFLLAIKSSDPNMPFAAPQWDEVSTARCLESLPRGTQLAVPTEFNVDRDGRVRRYRATWPKEWPAALVSCMDDVLARGRFTCPLEGEATVSGMFEIRVWTEHPIP